MLYPATAAILHRPRVALDCSLRVGVPAEVIEVAADDIVPDKRYELADLLCVESVRLEALAPGIGQCPGVERDLLLGTGKPDAVRRKLCRVAEEVVHERPQPLFLQKQRRMGMRAATAIAA